MVQACACWRTHVPAVAAVGAVGDVIYGAAYPHMRMLQLQLYEIAKCDTRSLQGIDWSPAAAGEWVQRASRLTNWQCRCASVITYIVPGPYI